MPTLEARFENGVAILTFDNPPLQVMTAETVNEINALLPRLRQEDVRVVIFTGASDAYFIRHFSVEELDGAAAGAAIAMERSIDAVFSDLEALPKPVIAALNASTAGGGLELAMSCDIRVAKDGPHQFGLPEVTIGILPGAGGTQRLPQLVGRHRALEMALRGRLISPSEALAIGLIEELVPEAAAETALDRALAVAGEIAAHPPLAVAHIKRLIRAAGAPVEPEKLKLESALFMELMGTQDARERLQIISDQHRAERKQN